MSPLTKSKLVNLYKKENDPKVKERLLLVIKVRENKQIPFRVVKEMHRSNNAWASDWLKRHEKEGVEGLYKIEQKAVDHPIKQKRSVTRLRKNYKKVVMVGPQNRWKS